MGYHDDCRRRDRRRERGLDCRRWPRYSTTGRAFIDRSWSADEVKEVNDDTVAAFAGLAFGVLLGGAQTFSAAQSIGARALWVLVSAAAGMFALVVGALMDGWPWDIVAAAALGDAPALAWLPGLSAFCCTIQLIYALPTGVMLWHLQRQASLARSRVLISHFD